MTRSGRAVLFAGTYRSEQEFQDAWPSAVDALERLHENDLILPDYRYELACLDLNATKSGATNEIEKALRRFWRFDERFWGQIPLRGGRSFRWSVYSLVYLAEDERVAADLLDVYCPLLGPYAVREFGLNFARKTCATFQDDTAHLIWEIQEAAAPNVQEYFDWRGHLNDLTDERRSALLEKAGLAPLIDVEIPPADVMREFCPAVHHAPVTSSYRRDLRRFYRELDRR
jgi:hypothetical protein